MSGRKFTLSSFFREYRPSVKSNAQVYLGKINASKKSFSGTIITIAASVNHLPWNSYFKPSIPLSLSDDLINVPSILTGPILSPEVSNCPITFT